jgi:hypothetical protein
MEREEREGMSWAGENSIKGLFTKESICVYTWMERDEREGMSWAGENTTKVLYSREASVTIPGQGNVHQGKHLCLNLDGEGGEGGDE